MNVHCVYIPDVIPFYMPDVTFVQKHSESALCLYSGCHAVHMPDVIFVKQKAVEVHCVYIPDVILFICGMFFVQQSNERALCVYSGCHSVYMPDVIIV